MSEPMYKTIAQLVGARINCLNTVESRMQSTTKEWAITHGDRILDLVKEHAPSGSGFDRGTVIDLDKSTADRLVFHTSFHHMDEHGSYDGWTDHTVTVTASLALGFDFKISGRNRGEIKEYISDAFHTFLSTDVP